jgi:hypothetical protein
MNKPKLFFFQACRGDREMTFKGYNFKPIKAYLTKIHYESDLLVYHSTFPDCKSWAKLIDNEPREGTIFIKSLCDVLIEAYRMLPNNLPLSQMITKINKSVSDEQLQLSDPKNTLTKEVFFTPKNVSVNLFSNFVSS